MAMSDEARMAGTGAWLQRASQDMRAAAHGLKAVPPLLDDVVFHCQQASEKALLGFLIWNGVPFRETHDIAEIGAQCAEIDSSLAPLIDRAAPLTEYAWKYRYPGGPEEPSVEEAQEALAITHEVAQAIIERLPQEAMER